jgi:AraC-like DNA-binding protein
MSKRTLQRRLTELGTRYLAVLAQARFDAARRMLQGPEVRVIDVSELLGYDNPSHFTRAFRRVAGVSPREYRKQMRLSG